MENNYLIYMHTSPSGKSYIGQTNNLKRRDSIHKNTNGCRAFANAIKKYGWDNFTHTILADGLSLDEANNLEVELIAKYGTLSPKGYNLRTGGDSPGFSEETRQKLSSAAKGRTISDAQRARLSELGKEIPPERIAKMVECARRSREENKDVPHYNLGRKHGEDHKQKTSAASKEHWADPSYRAKVIAARTGKKRSDDTKQKIAAAAMARWDRHRKEKEAAQGDLFI